MWTFLMTAKTEIWGIPPNLCFGGRKKSPENDHFQHTFITDVDIFNDRQNRDFEESPQISVLQVVKNLQKRKHFRMTSR